MALSRIVAFGNGSTTQFAIPFALGYIRRSDITCRVGNEQDGAGNPLYRTMTFISDELVDVALPVIGAGVRVEFTRTTDRENLLVDYEDGDIINEENMNIAQKQAIMLVHEVLDGRFEFFQADLYLGGFNIKQLADPIDAQDAATRNYVDSRIGTGAANAAAAAASATAAAGSATSAAGSATASGNSAAASDAARGISVAAANSTAGSVTAAATSATNAANSATTADGHRSAAAGSATAAANSATTAANTVTTIQASATAAANSATASDTARAASVTARNQSEGFATNASNSATASGNSATAAAGSVTTAAGHATNADTARGAAVVARDAARKWATADVNEPVNDGTNPAGYSAYHWSKIAEQAAGGGVSSWVGLAGAITLAQAKTALALSKGDVGLGNVDNTTDAGKPVSTAQQTALDLKTAKSANLSDLANVITGRQNLKIVTMTVAAYNALATKDADTLYHTY